MTQASSSSEHDVNSFLHFWTDARKQVSPIGHGCTYLLNVCGGPRRRHRNLHVLLCGGSPRRRRKYLLDVTIRRPSLSILSIRLVHQTLIVRFQRRFPSPFCFLLIYESLESLLTTFIFWCPALLVFFFLSFLQRRP
jgi:hypothetical protein